MRVNDKQYKRWSVSLTEFGRHLDLHYTVSEITPNPEGKAVRFRTGLGQQVDI
jgi:hypothetical protein